MNRNLLRILAVVTLSLLTSVVSASAQTMTPIATPGTTVVAGNPSCRPTLPSYPTISAALAAAPFAGTVLVCPQTFNEQVTITQAVTLQGVSNGNLGQPVLAPPAGGLTLTTTNDFGQGVAYQLWVNNASGPVNISNITIDGTGNGVSACLPFVVGVFYQNTPGTVNRVTTRNQKGNGCGIAIYVEGGASNPSVTIENSSVHDSDGYGIDIDYYSTITALVKGNDVSGIPYGIAFLNGNSDTATGNFVSGAYQGIYSYGSGSISGNTVMNSQYGIGAESNGVSVTSNKIMFSSVNAIDLGSAVATVSGNSITAAPVGVEFNCNANPHVHSNTINDAATGVDKVPAGVTTPNTYVNVAAIKTGC